VGHTDVRGLCGRRLHRCTFRFSPARGALVSGTPNPTAKGSLPRAKKGYTDDNTNCERTTDGWAATAKGSPVRACREPPPPPFAHPIVRVLELCGELGGARKIASASTFFHIVRSASTGTSTGNPLRSNASDSALHRGVALQPPASANALEARRSPNMMGFGCRAMHLIFPGPTLNEIR